MTLENRYTIDPRKIIVDFKKDVDSGGNPRTDYGTAEDWQDFKDSIATSGLRQNIKVYINGRGQHCLRHGYRRLKAVLELIKESRWTGNIEYDAVSESEVEGIIDHIVMNTGKPLTDLELARALVQLSKKTGKTKASELRDLTSIRVQKINKLMTFMDRAKPELIEQLSKNETSFDTAYQLATKAKNPRDQLQMLKAGVKEMKKNGDKKLLQKHLKPLRKRMDFNTQFGLLLTDAHKLKTVDKGFFEKLNTLVKLIKEEAPYMEQLAIFRED